MKNWYLHDGKVYRDQQLFTEDVLIIDGKIAAFGQKRKNVGPILPYLSKIFPLKLYY